MKRISTIQDLTVGQEYILPRGTAYGYHTVNGDHYNAQGTPSLVRITNIWKEDKHFTRVNFSFSEHSYLHGGDYNVMICSDIFYDELNEQFRKHNNLMVMYPLRELCNIFFILTDEMRDKINIFFQLERNNKKMSEELSLEYLKQIDSICKFFEDQNFYNNHVNTFLNNEI